MGSRILVRMRERIRKRQYVMTLHAEEEMDNDGLTIFDVESVILTGDLIEHSVTGRPGSESIWFEDKRSRVIKPLWSSADLAPPTNS